MESGRCMELDATLWSALPWDVVERVLSFLPVPDLSRCRSVCKTWDGVIRSREFGALYARSGGKPNASFLAIRCSLGQSKETIHAGWCFLDLEARRWYTVKDDLTPKLPKHISGDADLAVMDGGLICTYLKTTRLSYQLLLPRLISAPSTDTDNDQRFTLMVYNPIAKVLKVLPTVPAHQRALGYAKLTLVVDSMSQQFKVFLINQSINGGLAPAPAGVQTDPLMRIYDSATNEWHGTSTDPFCLSSRGVGRVQSIVMFEGLLYILFSSFSGNLGGHPVSDIGEELWRYHPVEDAWERVNVHIPYRLCDLKLFATASRLFMSGWFYDITEGLEVSEIKFPGMDLERVFAMSRADVLNLFHLQRSVANVVNAFGFGNSILLACKWSQKMRVLDLETRLWHWLPANPMWTDSLKDEIYIRAHFATPISHMNLMLPSSLWWQEGEGAADHNQIAINRSSPERVVFGKRYRRAHWDICSF